jgi:hypothetical protein
MIERLARIWDAVCRFLVELDPTLAPPQPPTLRRLDENRTQFHWQGPPLLFDSHAKTISRSGRVLAQYDAVRSISISKEEEDGETVSCSVAIDLGPLRRIVVGTCDDSVDASIAAAHIAGVIGKQVRVV